MKRVVYATTHDKYSKQAVIDVIKKSYGLTKEQAEEFYLEADSGIHNSLMEKYNIPTDRR